MECFRKNYLYLQDKVQWYKKSQWSLVTGISMKFFVYYYSPVCKCSLQSLTILQPIATLSWDKLTYGKIINFIKKYEVLIIKITRTVLL